jgi:hypothetical protein
VKLVDVGPLAPDAPGLRLRDEQEQSDCVASVTAAVRDERHRRRHYRDADLEMQGSSERRLATADSR